MAEEEVTQQPKEDAAPVVEAAAPAAAPAAPLANVDDRMRARHERMARGGAHDISRRGFLRMGFFGTMGLTLLASSYAFWNFMWPRKLLGFGGVVTVSKERVPQPGAEPVRILEGKFWLVNIKADEGAFGDFGENGSGGILALYQKCPHLGCTVPWVGGYQFQGHTGWFRCPCHGSTYTKGGVRVFGPAPRPLDTMLVSVNSNGSVEVDTGKITSGAADNPKRAVSYNA